MSKQNIAIVAVPVSSLKPATYNPRKWNNDQEEGLKESITRFGLVDPIIANGADKRKNVVIGGHFRLHIAKELGYTEVPVVYVNIPEIEREKELNLRLNKNTGSFDFKLLAEFDKAFLTDVGFSSEEMDEIFAVETNTGPDPEIWTPSLYINSLVYNDIYEKSLSHRSGNQGADS